MVQRVLIANRGEIAARILRTCAESGVEGYLAVSSADVDSLPARAADRTVCVGPARSTDSYLRKEGVLATALALGCDSVHPGYGFLAEDAQFARMCLEAGLTFIGPSPDMLELFGDKVAAREAAHQAGVPLIPGSTPVPDILSAIANAQRIGYPVMLKAAKGGGGKGMRIVRDDQELETVFPLASAEAQAAFGDGRLYVERWIPGARHVEVQVAGCAAGDVIHLGDRDCSVQRRQQKLVEEAPAPLVPESVQHDMRQAALHLCTHVGFDNVGTVEFLFDPDLNEFYFLEVNPRIQVEHGVTELVTGTDIVAIQMHAAETRELPLRQTDVQFHGNAIECRINAESPERGFAPSPGRIREWEIPTGPGVRVDTHCYAGYMVPPYYDSMLGKIMVHRDDRRAAVNGIRTVLAGARISGIDTNLRLAQWIIESADFQEMHLSTRWLDGKLKGGAWAGVES